MGVFSSDVWKRSFEARATSGLDGATSDLVGATCDLDGATSDLDGATCRHGPVRAGCGCSRVPVHCSGLAAASPIIPSPPLQTTWLLPRPSYSPGFSRQHVHVALVGWCGRTIPLLASADRLPACLLEATVEVGAPATWSWRGPFSLPPPPPWSPLLVEICRGARSLRGSALRGAVIAREARGRTLGPATCWVTGTCLGLLAGHEQSIFLAIWLRAYLCAVGALMMRACDDGRGLLGNLSPFEYSRSAAVFRRYWCCCGVAAVHDGLAAGHSNHTHAQPQG